MEEEIEIDFEKDINSSLFGISYPYLFILTISGEHIATYILFTSLSFKRLIICLIVLPLTIESSTIKILLSLIKWFNVDHGSTGGKPRQNRKSGTGGINIYYR